MQGRCDRQAGADRPPFAAGAAERNVDPEAAERARAGLLGRDEIRREGGLATGVTLGREQRGDRQLLHVLPPLRGFSCILSSSSQSIISAKTQVADPRHRHERADADRDPAEGGDAAVVILALRRPEPVEPGPAERKLTGRRPAMPSSRPSPMRVRSSPSGRAARDRRRDRQAGADRPLFAAGAVERHADPEAAERADLRSRAERPARRRCGRAATPIWPATSAAIINFS